MRQTLSVLSIRTASGILICYAELTLHYNPQGTSRAWSETQGASFFKSRLKDRAGLREPGMARSAKRMWPKKFYVGVPINSVLF
ncbi:hypothetical protein [Leptospira borgpetersenii]|uniref:hypothetical protein n=1 Tax=Leptospira borgpetersenii TaxID=174 RepID=UPI000AE571E5|nr:hypothetical protein [Leptospira borgpetersenii]